MTIALGGGTVSGPGASGWASEVTLTVEYEWVDVMEGTPLQIVERHCASSRTVLRAVMPGVTLSLPAVGSSTTGAAVTFTGAAGSIAFDGALDGISLRMSDGRLASTEVSWVAIP